VNLLFLGATLPVAFTLGSQFMPPLYEGSALYMPTSLPGLGTTAATQLLQEQDRIIRSFPEVESVLGVVGRSNSATDNAPFDMFDTTVMLRPRTEWPAGMTYEKLIQEMDRKLQFPGLSNTWTMPIANRLNMELTGIKTPVGIKIQGPTLEGIEEMGAQMERLLSGRLHVNNVFAGRVSQGFYVNVQVDRREAARYGLTVEDVQRRIVGHRGSEYRTDD
jgi:copper/silver efflux system protein